MRLSKQNITIDKDMWKQFVSVCQQLDTSASREVRRFVREFLQSHRQMSFEEIAKKAAK